MTAFKLTLEYDGTDFEGWQVQAGGRRTVQGVLERALADLGGVPVPLVGAGRTDAGVHAVGQVASLVLDTRLDAETLARALNARLSEDVAVVASESAPEGFHARRDARSKLYTYRLWNGRSPSPLRSRRFHHWPAPLDVGAMAEAARHLVGRHDFAALQGAGSGARTTIRNLFRAAVEGESGAEIRFALEGDGFLRHMVRNAVGTLLEVGSGRRSPDALPGLLASRDRRCAGPTAPARGLTLEWVRYGPAGARNPTESRGVGGASG